MFLLPHSLPNLGINNTEHITEWSPYSQTTCFQAQKFEEALLHVFMVSISRNMIIVTALQAFFTMGEKHTQENLNIHLIGYKIHSQFETERPRNIIKMLEFNLTPAVVWAIIKVGCSHKVSCSYLPHQPQKQINEKESTTLKHVAF